MWADDGRDRLTIELPEPAPGPSWWTRCWAWLLGRPVAPETTSDAALELPWRHRWDHLPKRTAGFGFSRRDITWIYVIQGVAMGLIGSTLGLLCGKLVLEGLRKVPIEMEGLVKSEGLLMSESPTQYIAAFVSAMIVVTAAAVYPARRAAKYDPVDVIRGAH